MVEKLRLKAKEQKGFTLIELLAVIVILGIIAAIAIPAITGVIHKSDRKAAAQEGISIINAAKMYVAEHPTEAASDVKNSTNLTHTQLDDYLDHVDDNTFEVVLGTEGTGGKYTFALIKHKANDAWADSETDPLDEQTLINDAK